MIFSHEYTKLKKNCFHTIRMNTGRYRVGKIIKITTPSCKFSALVVGVDHIKKADIGDDLARKDADCSPDELIGMLEGWYGKRYDDYVLIHLKKIL